MQYRVSPNGRRVQCLAAIYDSAAKRTRQKLVWTIDLHLQAINGSNGPTPEELSAGTPEQRVAWAKEIADYLADRAEQDTKTRSTRFIPIVEAGMKAIIDDLASQTPNLSDENRQRVPELVHGWAVGLTPKAPPRQARPKATAAAGEDPRAFGDELIKRARSLRNDGLSIAAVADKMTAEGHKVSKSWVQKWTH